MKKMIRIAIDGPGGAGKSTIAKIIADRLNIEYVDTGAMYRAIGLKLYKSGVNTNDDEVLKEVLDSTKIDYIDNRIQLDGIDAEDLIRTSEVSMMASKCSQKKLVREKLVAVQRQIAQNKSVVMDGRDIGTNVIKDAELKIFLTADAGIRAKRRYDQIIAKGNQASLEEIQNDIEKRDYQDVHRELNPLKKADDAVTIDTSDMTIEEIAVFIIKLLNRQQETV